MKKGIKAAVLAVLVVSALTCAAVSAAGERETAEKPRAEASADTRISYTLRICGDTVSVFSGGDSPLMDTEIEPSTLRGSDRELLKRGITVHSYEELLGLLEDFSG